MNTTPFQMGRNVPILLAEEWLVQPWEILPNTFEVILVRYAHRMIQTSLKDALQLLRTQLHRYRIRHVTKEDGKSNEDSFLLRLAKQLQRCSVRMAHMLDTILTRYHHEIHFTLRYILERQCIRYHSATLAEYMYGLRRSTMIGSTNKLQNDVHHTERLALITALGPYLQAKVQNGHSSWQRWTKHLVTTHQMADVLVLIAYMTNRTYFTSPVHALFRHVLRRITQGELSSTTSMHPSSSNGMPSPMMQSYSQHIPKLLSSMAILSYGLQFLSWYRHSNPPPIPDPPTKCHSRGCPMCKTLDVGDPTVLSTTGLVYCHACITRHMRIHRTCPVTGLPNPRWQRLHEPV